MAVKSIYDIVIKLKGKGYSDAQDVYAEHLESAVESLCDLCESPIEEALAIALFFADFKLENTDPPYALQKFGSPFPCVMSNEWDHKDFASDVFESVVIAPQQKIGAFRVDFLLIIRDVCFGNDIKLVVECDGHDYHERTKDQASRDKKRDRELTAQGYYVLRFTGSDIYKDAEGCAAEVAKFARNIWRQNGKVA